MHAQEEEAEGMVAGVSVPGSPQLRSGTSSFSHISSPASYRFGPSDAEDDGGRMGGDAGDESSSDGEGSAWTSDEVTPRLRRLYVQKKAWCLC